MILGYIYTKEYQEFENVFQKVDEISNDKPTLIVGWKLAKAMFPDDFSINNFCIKDNIYWSFTKERDRMVFEETLLKFRNLCIKYQIDRFDYEYYDLLQKPYSDLNFKDYETTLSRSGVVYIRRLESVIGISLELCLHLGFDILGDIENEKLKTHEIKDEFSRLEGYQIMCF